MNASKESFFPRNNLTLDRPWTDGTTVSALTKRNPFDKKKESAITAKRVVECRRYHLKVRGENQPKNHHLFV
jgi:hypothetical protein